MGQCRSPAGPKRRVSFLCVTTVLHESDWSQLSRPLSGIDRQGLVISGGRVVPLQDAAGGAVSPGGSPFAVVARNAAMLWPASRCQRRMGFVSVVTGGWGFCCRVPCQLEYNE